MTRKVKPSCPAYHNRVCKLYPKQSNPYGVLNKVKAAYLAYYLTIFDSEALVPFLIYFLNSPEFYAVKLTLTV